MNSLIKIVEHTVIINSIREGSIRIMGPYTVMLLKSFLDPTGLNYTVFVEKEADLRLPRVAP
jgi:hypothetical protein